MKLILGIETSCDETAAAVYNTEQGIISNVVFSQIDLHKKYGGVVPQIAAISHGEKIKEVVDNALQQAHVSLMNIDTIAVTTNPGLPGSLLIGISYAKSLAWAAKKTLLGINHLEGHIFSSFLEHNIPFPHLCLTASGGHTALYLVKNFGEYRLIAQTIDDAAGELFDKVAKLLGLAYPGGPLIEQYAIKQHNKDFFLYPRAGSKINDFSFSGLKTAILYDLIEKQLYDLRKKQCTPLLTTEIQEKIASSLLVCVKDIFIQKIIKAHKLYPEIKAVTFVGGVACNIYLRQELAAYVKSQRLSLFYPKKEYCTDNGAMIAFVGSYQKPPTHNNYNLDLPTKL